MTNLTSEIINLGSKNPAEVALVIDVSGSMANNDKLNITKAASARLIKLMRLNKDFLGICSFNSAGNVEWGANQKVELLTDGSVQALAIEAIHRLKAGGNTDMYQGLQLASKMFTSGVTNKGVVLLSDGLDTHTVLEKDLAKQLNQNKKEVYTIAIGDDADKPLLKELAGSDDRYNPVASAFVINEVFNKIIGQLGIADILLNKIETLPVNQFIGNVYPESQADNMVPAGKTEVVVAIAWDKLDVKCAAVNELKALANNQISFTVGKFENNSLQPIQAPASLTTIHKEPGVLIVKISGANAGEQYGVEMEKYFGQQGEISFSVGVFA